MNNAPKISILTPVWNGLPYLRECIQSVLAQNYVEWELLISDNGSTDGTRAYLDQLSDTRIRIFKQDENLGIMGNVNFLFSKAQAEICQILCADDYFIKATALDSIMNYWAATPEEIGFVRFNHEYDTRSRIIALENRIAPEIITSANSTLWFFTFGNIAGNLSEVSVRTAVVKETGEFDVSLPMAGDFDFWSRAAKRVSMGLQKERVIFLRRHEKVASNYLNLKGDAYRQHIMVYEKLIRELSATHDKSTLVKYFNYEICSFHYRNAIKSAIRGRFGYLNVILRANSPILWPKWRQIIFCMPFVLWNGKQKMTYRMAKTIIGTLLINGPVL